VKFGAVDNVTRLLALMAAWIPLPPGHPDPELCTDWMTASAKVNGREVKSVTRMVVTLMVTIGTCI